MSKRKIFIKTDLNVPQVNHIRTDEDRVIVPWETISPNMRMVMFEHNPSGRRSFDFTSWYGVGIDSITYACQIQIERFLAKQDAEVAIPTVVYYCESGIRFFLTYLTLRSAALGANLDLNDINRELIDGYLRSLVDSGVSTTEQRRRYVAAKSILKALCYRGLVRETLAGENATFPSNPFPGANRKYKGETSLPKKQRTAFSMAVKTAVMPIYSDDVEPSAELLSYALLIVALHTGRNTTPLLEMTQDCLRSHPKDDTLFLVLYKRRGHNTSKVAIRAESEREKVIESLPTIRPTVGQLLHRVFHIASRLRSEAPPHLANRVWLYRSQQRRLPVGTVDALNTNCIGDAIRALVHDYGLCDADGKPLRINISRLRKTFVNRIYEILDGDIAGTATAAGNSPQVINKNYLRPGEEARRNWKFMGTALVQELLTNTIGATERTLVGRCSDPIKGHYAPKRDDAVCMNFLNCLRCRNYVVTADDLYRLFSFYWRILSERSKMDKRRWTKQFAHIARLIEMDVIQVGVEKGIFNKLQVESERERARYDPHPFWRSQSIMADLHGGLA